jgi:glutathione synthase/RimK-type ligase-like ATP-grasp enzyme
MTSVFGDLITQAAEAEDISVELFNDGWVHKYFRGDKTYFSYGYQFPLNTGVSQQLATDKCATYELLASVNLPAVAHTLVTNWEQDAQGKWQRSQGNAKHMTTATEKLVKQHGLPVVTKPVAGTGGQDVRIAHTQKNLTAQITALLQKQNMAAISPFVDATHETRIYVLDDTCLLAYQKQKLPNEWRFNLGHGALAQLCSPSDELLALARQALRTLGLRLGAVDFLHTAKGPIILEVNSGIMLNNFAAQSPQQKGLAIEMYRKILHEMFV